VRTSVDHRASRYALLRRPAYLQKQKTPVPETRLPAGAKSMASEDNVEREVDYAKANPRTCCKDLDNRTSVDTQTNLVAG
jgi:hypothetical protein